MVLGPEGVGDPRPQGSAGPRRPGRCASSRARLLVVAVLGVHRTDDRDVVGVPGDPRQGLAELQPRLAMPGEPELASSRLPVTFSSSATSAEGLAVVPVRASAWGRTGRGEARPAVHEELDHRPGLRAGACGGRGCTSNEEGDSRRRGHRRASAARARPPKPPPSLARTSPTCRDVCSQRRGEWKAVPHRSVPRIGVDQST